MKRKHRPTARLAQVCAGAALLAASGLTLAAPSFAQQPTDPLSQSFLSPPSTAKPQVWWHWVNGNVTKPGITADLEAMKKAGIGGGTICSLGAYAPEGPAHFNSPVWWDDVSFAMNEAGRLGLELGVENCEGWSSSGGPWVKPADAMKMLVWSESSVEGGSHAPIHLAQPPTRLDFYRDAAVVAFPATAADAGPSLADIAPKVTIAGAPVDTSFLFTGDSAKSIPVPAGDGITIDCGKPFVASSLRFSHGAHFSGGTTELDSSNDGVDWTKAASVATPGDSIDWLGHATFAPITARYFRVRFLDGSGKPAATDLAMLNLADPAGPSFDLSQPGDTVQAADVVDLTSKMRPDGTLAWSPPAGRRWTVVRFGFTDVGVENHPASKYGIGLEIDKLSKVALEHHFEGFFNKVMATGAAAPGHALQWSLIDSYEVGPQNWTDDFPAEFKAQEGYAITPWLVTFTGRTVDSADKTSRFQYDFDHTIRQLWDTNYWGYFGDLLRKHGLRSQVEAYGNGPFDTVRSSGLADMPMSEFWYPSAGDARLAKQAASAAHVYGHTLVGAESFTAGGDYFDATPWKMKREGDNILAAGVNRFYFHSGESQPGTDDKKPGLTWNYGIFQNRNNTWYQSGSAYNTYLARCDSLLQQGRFVGDILAFEGDQGNGSQSLFAPPTGYASDEIDSDLLVKSVTVDHGQLALPDGERYAVLALANSDSISLPVLEKVAALVRAGATVWGPKPVHALGLSGYPASEAALTKLADSLWGNIDGAKVIKHQVGKGWVYWTGDFKNITPALDDRKIAPDFTAETHSSQLRYLHRRIGEADSYFISSQSPNPMTVNAQFRVSGEQPEIWDPQADTVADAAVWSADGPDRTTVPLELRPGGSVFVVFRHPAPKAHLEDVTLAGPATGPDAAQTLVITKAIYGDIKGHGGTVDITDTLQKMVDDNEIDATIDNDLAGTDPAYLVTKSAQIDYTLGGKPGSVTVPEHGTLDLPLSAHHTVKFTVSRSADGTDQLVPWAAGTYTATDSAGKKSTVQVASTPEPITVDGPWTVHFDPRWGGPASTQFDTLTDWTKNADLGIKYYSGTAEYDKTITVPADWLKPGRVVALDLGDLESLANVTINGHALPCLWSPPYRAIVTGLLHPGANTLTIAVTNTWVNRLIGDDNLPADQRLTTTTKHFYSPTSPLIPSGLFGPVTLTAADPVKL